MAKYGVKLYGSGFKYGQTSTISVYYNSKIMAWAYDYNTTIVSWGTIVPDPSDPAPTHWKLVKSYQGTLDDPLDGITVAGGPWSAFSTSYTDVDVQTTDIEASYSIWLFNGSRWIFCGDAYTVLVSNKDSLANMTSWFPKAWVNSVEGTGDALGEPNSNTLVTILGAMAFVYDKFRTEASILGNSWNPIFTPSAILDLRGPSYGVFYEAALGDAYNRSLSNVANIVNAHKGTSLALKTYTTALTHLGANVYVGHNLMLDYNDASFEESLGQWTASSGTFSWTTYTTESLSGPTTTNVLYDPLYPIRSVGLAKLSTASTTPVTLSQNSTAPGLHGIPVTAGTRYVFSGWVRHATNGGTVSTTIKWYDRTGVLLSTTSAGANTTTINSGWKEFTSLSSSGRNGTAAPTNAAFALPQILVTPSSGSASNFYIDMLQFAEASKSFEYQDARRIHVSLVGEKENYLTNPDFEYGFSGWTAYNGYLSTDTVTITPFVSSARVAKLIAPSAGRAAYISDWVSVSPGRTISFSAYVQGSAARSAVARIEFSNQSTLEIQSQILSDTDGNYYPTTPYYVDSTPVTLSTSAKTLVTVSAISSPSSADTGSTLAKVSIYFDNNVANDSYWLDGTILEQTAVSSPYFNGNGGRFPSNPVTTTYYSPLDCKWETKNIYNYVSNPSFEVDTTDWVTTAGTLTRVATDAGLGPLFGSYFGKLTYSGYGAFSVTGYLPTAALGGEDVVFSIFVRGGNNTYTPDAPFANTVVVPAAEGVKWTRIVATQPLSPGQTTVSININVTGATYCHIDGAQIEYGRVANAFVNPATATIISNPLTSGKTIYANQVQSVGGGKSSYFYNHNVKKSRLNSTIGKYMPAGSTWAIASGTRLPSYPDLPSSLVLASSFESNTSGWSGNNANIYRKVAGGSILGDNATHGQAYCIVVRSGSSAFGLTTGNIPVSPTGGYYASVAIRPGDSTVFANYTLTVNFYTGSGTLIPVYTDNITGLYTTSSTDSTGASNTLSTSAARSKTVAINHSDRWAYLANTFIQSSITGASYAILSVSCDAAAGSMFHIDRVVFRQ